MSTPADQILRAWVRLASPGWGQGAPDPRPVAEAWCETHEAAKVQYASGWRCLACEREAYRRRAETRRGRRR